MFKFAGLCGESFHSQWSDSEMLWAASRKPISTAGAGFLLQNYFIILICEQSSVWFVILPKWDS